MFLKFSNMIGFFSLGLKKLIWSKFWIHKFVIEWISFLEAALTFLDFLKLEVLDFTILETYWAMIIRLWDKFKDLKLVDYKVRILNTGTEAVTRVSIESTDSKGVNWFTIGVSPNIIDASFKALVDSLDYKLFKDKAPASL